MSTDCPAHAQGLPVLEPYMKRLVLSNVVLMHFIIPSTTEFRHTGTGTDWETRHYMHSACGPVQISTNSRVGFKSMTQYDHQEPFIHSSEDANGLSRSLCGQPFTRYLLLNFDEQSCSICCGGLLRSFKGALKLKSRVTLEKVNLASALVAKWFDALKTEFL